MPYIILIIFQQFFVAFQNLILGGQHLCCSTIHWGGFFNLICVGGFWHCNIPFTNAVFMFLKLFNCCVRASLFQVFDFVFLVKKAYIYDPAWHALPSIVGILKFSSFCLISSGGWQWHEGDCRRGLEETFIPSIIGEFWTITSLGWMVA